MNKKIGMIGIGVLLITMLAMYVNAAVTGCMDETSTPVAYKYNDTGVIKNVTAGRVCIDATDYDVAPTVAVNCDDDWANYTDGGCLYSGFYVGYAGDGTTTCVATNWVYKEGPYYIGEGMIINETINGPRSYSGAHVTTTGEVVPAKTACYNAYIQKGPSGYCDGAGRLDTDDARANVSAGNVCMTGALNADPNATVSCSDAWANYTDGWCAYTRFYVGYVGDGTATCTATGWIVRTANVYIAQDYIINNTVNGLISSDYVTNTGETASYNACSNLYTRMGPTGYCNGGGVLDTNSSTLHVAAGKVCTVGTNLAPNASLNCGTWSNCIAGGTTANEYFVGYAASGTSCVDTSWVVAGTTQTAITGLRWRNTEHVDSCATLGYAKTYDKSDMPKILADGLGTAGAEFVDVIDLIVIALVLSFVGGLVYTYMKNK